MATSEDEPQYVIAEDKVVIEAIRFLWRQRLLDLALLRPLKDVLPQAIDGLVTTQPHEPCARAGRSLMGSLLHEGCREGILQVIFGELEITQRRISVANARPASARKIVSASMWLIGAASG